MAFEWTQQQLAIFNEIANPTNKVLKIEATAGSSKSSSLVEAIKRYKQSNPDATVQYLIFGRMAALEAKREFSNNAIVSTLHSFAFQHTVKKFDLGTVKSFLTWKDIPKSVIRPFGKDPQLISLLEDYCESPYLSIDEYVQNYPNEFTEYDLIKPLKQILNLMSCNKMPITHYFYLKLFHLFVMSGKIKLNKVNRLLIDEAQDLSKVALDIISKVPYDQLVLVGDQNQRIFSFMNLENGFERYPDSKVLNLSKSFRVDSKYAPAIQGFLRKHLNISAVFDGMDYASKGKYPVLTKAYLTRTNASLIAKMIEFNENETPYHLAHTGKLKDMFKIPLAVLYAHVGKIEKDPELKHFQEVVDSFEKYKKYSDMTLYSYLASSEELSEKFKSAISLVMRFDKEQILKAYELANEHKKHACNMQLMTVHSSKGTTRDEIELDDDIDKSLEKILKSPHKHSVEDIRAELCLYFVACTRHRHNLFNAKYLETI